MYRDTAVDRYAEERALQFLTTNRGSEKKKRSRTCQSRIQRITHALIIIIYLLLTRPPNITKLRKSRKIRITAKRWRVKSRIRRSITFLNSPSDGDLDSELLSATVPAGRAPRLLRNLIKHARIRVVFMATEVSNYSIFIYIIRLIYTNIRANKLIRPESVHRFAANFRHKCRSKPIRLITRATILMIMTVFFPFIVFIITIIIGRCVNFIGA